jgi:hypothetical protein
VAADQGADSVAATHRRVNARIEQSLQQEVMLQLRSAEVRGMLRCLYYPIPNGVYIPARTGAEKTMAARIVAQLKNQGGLVPGAPDLVFLARGNSGAIELKRPEVRTLLDVYRKGTLSKAQREQRIRFESMGINWAICSTWAEVRDTLSEWGMLAI